MPIHDATLGDDGEDKRDDGEDKIKTEAVRRILKAVNAESNFNDEQFKALQDDLEKIRFWHRIDQRLASPKRRTREIRERAGEISKAAKKILKLFNGDAGQEVYKKWFELYCTRDIFGKPIVRQEGLSRPSESIPDLGEIKACLNCLKTFEIYIAKFEFAPDDPDGGLIRSAVEYLMPKYEAHFGRPPTRSRSEKGSFPNFAVAVCEELNIHTVRGKPPTDETIIHIMGKLQNSDED